MKNTKAREWTPLPPDMLSLSMLVGFMILILVALTNPWAVYQAALLSGVIGIALLFFARLPLYRERRFFVFGPRHLDEAHRRLYRCAYVFLGIAVVLFLLLLPVSSGGPTGGGAPPRVLGK